MTGAESEHLVVGRITGAYGVKGWVKVHSETRPRANILNYSPWHLSKDQKFRTVSILDSREHPNALVVLLDGSDGRDGAAALVGSEISVDRLQLPALEDDEEYWSDLIGCRVRTGKREELGKVTGLIETGSHDVLVIQGEREYLIPYVLNVYVMRVDLEARIVEVDWEGEE